MKPGVAVFPAPRPSRNNTQPATLLAIHITRPRPRHRQRAPVAQPGRCQPSQERCLGKAKVAGSKAEPIGGKPRPGLYPQKKTLSSLSARLHLRNPTPPSGQLSHLLQNILLRLLAIHPSRIHRRLHHILKLLLKRQQLPLHISAMNTVRVIRVLSAMLLVGRHGHSTALTAQR